MSRPWSHICRLRALTRACRRVFGNFRKGGIFHMSGTRNVHVRGELLKLESVWNGVGLVLDHALWFDATEYLRMVTG